MIVSRIDGGLGNQMFQYAYGWYLARRHNCQLWLDVSAFDSGPQHGYLLDRFQITAGTAAGEILKQIPLRYCSPTQPVPRGGLMAQLRDLFSNQRLRRHKESPFGFHPRHLAVPTRRYLVGYWQSEKFFPGLRDELLRQFTPGSDLSNESARILERIRTTNSLALHVRRGDYLKDAASQIYYPLGLDYYQAAIDDWSRGAAQSDLPPEVFVFSNDISWCRQQFSLPWKTNFVGHNTAASAHEDMLLMSASAYCVIANSTFSWWAAWLNQRPGHAVYAPNHWFQPGTLDATHIVPTRWQRPT